MAKEYTGVMLVMAAILRCKEGQRLLKSAKKRNFKQDWLIKDWILLVETLLQWEAYLNLDQMEKKHVIRLKQKHRFIMYLLKKVGNRTKGMGFKIMKFHAIIHLAFDILMFGVPMVVDTGSNESHHKTTKVAAKLTQKDIKTFEKQTSHRLDDFHVLDLAMEEMDGRPLFAYFYGWVHDDPPEVDTEIHVGGMQFVVSRDADNDDNVKPRIITRMVNWDNVCFDTQMLEFIMDIQEELEEFVGQMTVYAEHRREGIIFRGHPNYRGKGPWRDWVMVNWNVGDYPAQIWAFLDLREMDIDGEVELDDGTVVGKNVYAVVESCNYIDEGDSPLSDIFTPLKLETQAVDADGTVMTRKFYLVDVETFKEPIVVIPNVGTKDEYLLMAGRSTWHEDFITWINMPHTHDKMEMLSEHEESEESEEEEEEENSD